MSLYLRPDSPYWWINAQWRGCPRLHLSTRYRENQKKQAQQLVTTLKSLRAAGRFDLLGLVASHRLDLSKVHATYVNDPAALVRLTVSEPSPQLGDLVGEWLEWAASPAGLSHRTQGRYSPQTIRRYRVSWNRILASLPKGPATTLAELTAGAIAEYRKSRIAGGCTGPTVNRDICAIQSLLKYCEEERQMALVRPKMKKQRESQGRERWLSAAEIEVARTSSPPEWWPLFAVLIYTGLRIGEAQGLRWADIRLTDQVIAVHEGFRRLKTRSSDRDVPIPEPLAEVMAAHAVRVPNGPADLVFRGELGDYGGARRAWRRICLAGGLAECRIHDLRHTFGVHAARSGVPLVRLQRLMGHSTPTMTLRYMRHAPDGDFASDAARVADSMNPARLDESTRARLVRSNIRRA